MCVLLTSNEMDAAPFVPYLSDVCTVNHFYYIIVIIFSANQTDTTLNCKTTGDELYSQVAKKKFLSPVLQVVDVCRL